MPRIIITGATSGVGLATAKLLAKKENELILVGRNLEKGNETIQFLKSNYPVEKIHFILMDLSAKKSIVKGCDEIKKLVDAVDVLINNAGYITSYHALSEDNIEMQMAVNHYAPILLVHELFPLLQKSAQARIIQVSSRAHSRGKIFWDDINLNKNYSLSKSYNQSKLANLLASYKLADLLKESKITINSFHPGLVNTKIGEKHTDLISNYAWKLIKLLGNSPNKSALDAVYLASDQGLAKVSGKYFHQKKQIKSSTASHNKEDIERIWNHSCEVLGISTEFPISS